MLYTFEIRGISSSCSVNLRSSLKIKTIIEFTVNKIASQTQKWEGINIWFLIKMIKCLKTDCSFNSSISFNSHSFSTHDIYNFNVYTVYRVKKQINA